MSFPVRFRPQVSDEIIEAMAWYADRSPGLETAFFRTFEAAARSLADQPERYRKIFGEVRRIILPRFPYVVFYRFDGEEVVVLSVQHERRSPDRWPGG